VDVDVTVFCDQAMLLMGRRGCLGGEVGFESGLTWRGCTLSQEGLIVLCESSR
jgi:hypothetical protein